MHTGQLRHRGVRGRRAGGRALHAGMTCDFTIVRWVYTLFLLHPSDTSHIPIHHKYPTTNATQPYQNHQQRQQQQTVLQDLSAGLALIVDRPFELGDFVSTGGFKGYVTSIGLKVRAVRRLLLWTCDVCGRGSVVTGGLRHLHRAAGTFLI